MVGIAIIGSGRLGTALAYKLGKNKKKIFFYSHKQEICYSINTEHLNPKHLTNDLIKYFGGLNKIPRLTKNIIATNDLEKIIMENDYIILAINISSLSKIINYIKPFIKKKNRYTYFISPIKGIAFDNLTKKLKTPSQIIHSNLNFITHKYDIISIGGPFFDMDLVLGKPICLTIAGKKHSCELIRNEIINCSRRELTSYYNFDIIGVECCGAFKNVVANLKGIIDCLDLGPSLSGTIFTRAGVEIRILIMLLGGSFQVFNSQAGIGDLYVTISSEISKNYCYGKMFYKFYKNGNSIEEINKKILKMIDGTPEGPNTIRNLYYFLSKKNLYSPLFKNTYKIFNEINDKKAISELIIQICQFDRRTKEYVNPFSLLLYKIIPNFWYRREKFFLN